MNPKILVGCPTSFHKEYCLEQYANAVKSLTYPNHDILLVDNSPDDNYLNKIKSLGLPVIKGPYFEGARDRIIASRNILRQKVLDEGYDYFFSLEQDVIPPKDVLERLIRHNKKIISCIYFARNVINDKVMLIPLAYVLLDKDLSMRPLNEFELAQPRLMRIVSCGLGCVLIHRDVLKDIKFRYEENTFDDRWFCIDAFNKKFEIYADTGIKCKHFILNRPYQWKDIKK